MQKIMVLCFAFVFAINYYLSAQVSYDKHPNTSGAGWTNLFHTDLSDAIFEKEVWTVSDGVFTASKDEALWSEKAYDNFILDLEFKNAGGTNSGVIVHATDIKEWIPILWKYKLPMTILKNGIKWCLHGNVLPYSGTSHQPSAQ